MALPQCLFWKPWNSELVLRYSPDETKNIIALRDLCYQLILMLPNVSLMKLPIITTTIPLAAASFSSFH